MPANNQQRATSGGAVVRSRYIVFPASGRVELAEECVAALGAGEVLCEAVVSLISTGTESSCLRGVFDPGTKWAD